MPDPAQNWVVENPGPIKAVLEVDGDHLWYWQRLVSLHNLFTHRQLLYESEYDNIIQLSELGHFCTPSHQTRTTLDAIHFHMSLLLVMEGINHKGWAIRMVICLICRWKDLVAKNSLYMHSPPLQINGLWLPPLRVLICNSLLPPTTNLLHPLMQRFFLLVVHKSHNPKALDVFPSTYWLFSTFQVEDELLQLMT